MFRKNPLMKMTMAVFLVQMGFAFGNNSLSVMINPLAEEFHLTGTAQGFPSSILQTGGLICVLLVPFIVARVSMVNLLFLGSMLQGVMTLFTGVIHHPIFLYISFAFVGVGGGVIDVLGNASIIGLHGENSTKYMGMLHGLYAVGAVATPLFIEWLLPYGWRSVYMIASVPLIFIALYYHRVFRQHGKTCGTLREEKLNRESLRQFFARSANWQLALSFFFYVAAQFVLIGWLVRYMRVQFGEETLGAIALSLYWIFATLNRFIIPRLPVPTVKLIAWGLVLGGLIYWASVQWNQAYLWLFSSCLIGFSSGHVLPLLINQAVRLNPNHSALSTSVMQLCNKAGLVVTPLVLGFVSQWSMSFSMHLGEIFMFISLLFLLPMIEKRGPQPRASWSPEKGFIENVEEAPRLKKTEIG